MERRLRPGAIPVGTACHPLCVANPCNARDTDMARFRAGYEGDYGLRDFDSHRPRFDVGSRGYDRGYRRLETFGSGYQRPWTGGYHEGYQGGSEGIALNTAPTGGAWVRGEGSRGRSGYDRDSRYDRGWTRPGSQRGAFDRGDQGYAGGGGEYDPGYARRGQARQRGGFRPSDEDYRRDAEFDRSRFSPGMGMSGPAAYERAYGRGYDEGWFDRGRRRP